MLLRSARLLRGCGGNGDLRRQFSSSHGLDLNFTQHLPAHASGPLKEPLLVFHGLLGAASNWRLITRFPSVFQNRALVLGELRNHGGSPHSDDMSWQAMAQDTVRLLDRLQVEKCVLLGHSLGGKMAMATALLHPDRVAKLIVADISPTHYEERSNSSWSSVIKVVEALKSLDVAQVRDRTHADTMLAASIVDKGLRQFVLQNLQPPQEGQSSWSLRCNINTLHKSMGQFATFPFDPEQYSFKGPSLFISGALSSYLTPKHHPRVLQFFPAAQFESVPGAGHWLHAENPQDFFPRVAKFINA
jgi:pimeloyl-ACP methyl ester carboxylesterase